MFLSQINSCIKNLFHILNIFWESNPKFHKFTMFDEFLHFKTYLYKSEI